MGRFILSRLLTLIPLFIVVASTIFLLIRFAPGGPFDGEKEIPPEIKKNIEAKYHLDEPIWMQYFRFWGDLLRGDLGPSFKYSNRTVNEIIAETFPVSLQLGLLSFTWALLFGFGLGLLSSLYPRTLLDYVPVAFSVIGICLPSFVIGPTLSLFFGIKLQWLPVAGWDGWQSKILPSLTLGTAYAAYISRLTRGGFLKVMNQDFIRTAVALGTPKQRILIRHALKGAITPLVTFLGPALAGIVTGALVTETIYQIPGLGRFFVESALNRDYTVIMGTGLLYFALLFFSNFAVDILYTFLDPRVKYE